MSCEIDTFFPLYLPHPHIPVTLKILVFNISSSQFNDISDMILLFSISSLSRSIFCIQLKVHKPRKCVLSYYTKLLLR